MAFINLKSFLSNIQIGVLDLLWPPVCAVCREPLRLVDDPLDPSGSLCKTCLKTVELLPETICQVCGRPFWKAAGQVCGDCLARPPLFRQARAAVGYHGGVAKSIGILKYRGGLNQLRVLRALAAPRLTPPHFSVAYDFIVPIPISPKRFGERGYNQALELAKSLYGPWRRLIDAGLLLRPTDGRRHQVGLSGKERRRAIKGCFKVSDPGKIKGARILLVDDVLTTGATAEEAAHTLLMAGADYVDLATVARTILDSWR